MRLTIDGVDTEFMPLEAFQQLYQLPPTFHMAAFEFKAHPETASMRGAGPALQAVRDAVVAAVPETMPSAGWSSLAIELQLVFRTQLLAVNSQVGLKPSEIDFAVNGLGEVLHLFMQSTFKALISARIPPTPAAIYRHWLDSSVEVARVPLLYCHGSQEWRIWPIRCAYGRVGLKIDTGMATYHVADKRLACPAEGFMASLLHEIIERLSRLITSPNV